MPTPPRRAPQRPPERAPEHAHDRTPRRPHGLVQLAIAAAPASVARRPGSVDRIDRTSRTSRSSRNDGTDTAGTRPFGVVAGRLALVVAAVVPAFAAALVEQPRAAAVIAAAATAIVLAVLRWSPAVDDDERRPVPARALVLTAGLTVQLFVLAAGHPSWAPIVVGPLATATIVLTYLGAFGFRSTFLLRRIVLVSLLLWQPVATLAVEVVRSSIDPLSDLLHRRLAAVEALGVSEHPWRVFTAMTDRGEVIVIASALMATAMTRRRLTARRVLELATAATVALAAHHTMLLTAPIERYERSIWVDVVTSTGLELLLGGAAAAAAAHLAARAVRRGGSTQSPGVTAAPDRDPVLFAVRAGDQASTAVRAATAGLAVVLLTAVAAIVLQTVTP